MSKLLIFSANGRPSRADIFNSIYRMATDVLPIANKASLQFDTSDANWFVTLPVEEVVDYEQFIGLAEAGWKKGIDINMVPIHKLKVQYKLLLMDVDSTMIKQESVDEVADRMGVKDKVAEITEQAMRGELDFAVALRQRLQLLRGTPKQVFLDVYETLQPQDGLTECLAWAKSHAIYCACVSGGFNIIVEKLAKQFKLDAYLAHDLIFAEEKFTGEFAGNSVNKPAKADYLQALCKKLKINPSQAIVLGDGANDSAMMQQAGLRIGIKPKAALMPELDLILQYTSLILIKQLVQNLRQSFS